MYLHTSLPCLAYQRFIFRSFIYLSQTTITRRSLFYFSLIFLFLFQLINQRFAVIYDFFFSSFARSKRVLQKDFPSVQLFSINGYNGFMQINVWKKKFPDSTCDDWFPYSAINHFFPFLPPQVFFKYKKKVIENLHINVWWWWWAFMIDNCEIFFINVCGLFDFAPDLLCFSF